MYVKVLLLLLVVVAVAVVDPVVGGANMNLVFCLEGDFAFSLNAIFMLSVKVETKKYPKGKPRKRRDSRGAVTPLDLMN